MSQTAPITVLRSRADLKTWRDQQRRNGQTVGLVPTMGALHAGHLSLLNLTRQHADIVGASLFVNPTQFAPNEDFSTYPRNEAQDLEMLASAGCRFVYCPDPEEVYPPGDCTRVLVKGLSHILEGEHRPHFFEGVATVVSRLFVHVEPDVAAFGEKDYQQLQILRRMTTDLGFGVKILGGETIREDSGLAMSSRNAYLAPEELERAAAIHRAMSRAAEALEAGENIADAQAQIISALEDVKFNSIDYVEVRDAETLATFDTSEAPEGVSGRILIAAWMNKTRLIDNLAFKRS